MIEDSYLYREIQEQPRVLRTLLKAETSHIEALSREVLKREITHVVIAARGTSDNAARYAQYLWGAVNGLPVALATPSLHTIYKRPPRYKNAMVVGISQSGKSPDIVSVVAEGNRQGALSVALTNEPDSDLARVANHVIGLNAGPERSVAATKTYISQLMAIAMLSAAVAADRSMLAVLEDIPVKVQETLTIAPVVARLAERYRYMRVCVVIGRGYNYATAFETSLKIKELNYVVAEPYSSADFMHGPLALIEEAFPTIVIAPSGLILPEMKAFIAALNERGAEVIAISDDDEALRLARIPIRLPVSVPEWVSPLVSIIPGQLFAMYLAHVRDFDVDRPRAIHKVTETR
jgi:glucosamine--fructose-6-phosphate aminotransferase (isomerizing)